MKSGPPCALLWRILTWCSRKQVTFKALHIPGRLNVVADKLSRLGQTIQTVVSPPSGLPVHMQQVASASNRPFCYEVQQQTDPVCVTSTRPPGLGNRCTQPVLGGSGPICLPTSSHLGQSGGEGFCLLQERLRQRHLPATICSWIKHIDCDPMLWALWSGGPDFTSD